MNFKRSLFLSLLILLIGACSNAELVTTDPSDDIHSEIAKELAALSSDKEKRQYLEQVFEDDQKYRGEYGREIETTYGKDSDEYVEFRNSFNSMDEQNLHKVEAYLNKFGHPKKENVGAYATNAPYMVIHHANEYAPRVKHFKTLYTAFLNGDIEESLMHMFIGRMHKMENGKDFNYLSRNSLQKEMDEMITSLGLLEMKHLAEKGIREAS